jgi:hypothetical protein
MPHKFNAVRRDKISKQKHRVTNYAEYDESLRRRGDLTVWISMTRMRFGRFHRARHHVANLSILTWRLRCA